MHKIFATLAILLISALTFGSCQSKSEELEKGRVLHVDIEPHEVAVEDLFDRIEVVPLETNDSSLIYHIYNRCVTDSDIYVQDFKAMVVYRFGANGRFKNRIGRIGQGPGEFTLSYGFDIDSDKNKAYIVSAFGKVYEYSLTGEFIRDYELPWNNSYQNIKKVNDNRWITWTLSDYGQRPISILNAAMDTVLCKPDVPHHLANKTYSSPNFFRKSGKLYVSFNYDNNVYEFCDDSLSVAYTWDFGDYNISEEALAVHDIDPSKESHEVVYNRQDNFLNDPKMKLAYLYSMSNNEYDITNVRYMSKDEDAKPVFMKVFNDSEKKKTYSFLQLKNGMLSDPVRICTDDYILYQIPWKELPLYEEYLPEGMKLNDIDPDDDNPVLARFYFKK